MLPRHTLTQAIDRCAREEWGRILSALTGSLGDLQLAEDSLQDAVTTAMTVWARDGLPRAPAAWLITTARRRAIDRLRRDRIFAAKMPELSYLADLADGAADVPDNVIPDKRLEMIFTCCHPAIAEKSRIALTLRTLGGLSTDDIAAAFLDKPATMAQRLARAKAKIAAAGIPYAIPDRAALPDRVAGVLSVIYLIFNAGYGGTGPAQDRLCDEAIRLGRILHHLMPDEAEVAGLLALMLLHDSRRLARRDAAGAMIPLSDQNRARWDRAKRREGDALLRATLPLGRVGPYQVQAAISGVHAAAASWDATDWVEICGLYELLHRMQPSPVVRINQAIAVSYAVSLAAGRALLDTVASDPGMAAYQPFHAARADLLARNGDADAARAAYDRAIVLATDEGMRLFLQAKRDALGGPARIALG